MLEPAKNPVNNDISSAASFDMSLPPDHFSRTAIRWIEYGGLTIIVIATLVAGFYEIVNMFKAGKVTLGDLLLLFIYLEVIAMVGVYLDSGKLPVRMPIYIAIVALARYLALDSKSMETWRFFAVSGAIIMLATAVLVIRYGHHKFPYSRANYLKEDNDDIH